MLEYEAGETQPLSCLPSEHSCARMTSFESSKFEQLHVWKRNPIRVSCWRACACIRHHLFHPERVRKILHAPSVARSVPKHPKLLKLLAVCAVPQLGVSQAHRHQLLVEIF